METRYCDMCRRPLERKVYGEGIFYKGRETPSKFAKRRFCSKQCAGRAGYLDRQTGGRKHDGSLPEHA